MVLVKIEPQPAILRSCDMVMAHYLCLLDSKLDSSLGTREVAQNLEWTAFPRSLNLACCMCLNRGEGKIQPYLFHFPVVCRCFITCQSFSLLSFLE